LITLKNITKMIITTKKEITVEHEITLPMYVQSGDIHFYMIVSEDEAIQITNSKWSGGSITTVPMKVALMGDYKKIEPEEYNIQFDIILNQLVKRVKY
jgi:hypothetical protein